MEFKRKCCSFLICINLQWLQVLFRGAENGAGSCLVQQGALAHRTESQRAAGRRVCCMLLGRSSLQLRWVLQLWGYFPSKPAVDSNTVHLFKAISNMSCLTSFKSYLTPRNSHEFTVRIKEENSQRQRNYHFHFVHCCCLERTWRACLPADEYVITFLTTQFLMEKKAFYKSLTPLVLIAEITSKRKWILE